VLQAAQQRIVNDIARAVKILKGAAGDVRKVASGGTAADSVASKRPVRRKAKSKSTSRVERKAGKAKRPVRRPKAKARAKGATRRLRRR
jgi:hypothetical protein